MILGDDAIVNALESGHIGCDPEPDAVQVQPASLDLRLGDTFVHPYTGERSSKREIEIRPSGRVLGKTRARFEIPLDLTGFVTGRSTLGRLFVTVHQTAGLIDPGYEGNITLEMANIGTESQTLQVGDRVAQIYFAETKGVSAGYTGQYQNQEEPQQAGEL